MSKAQWPDARCKERRPRSAQRCGEMLGSLVSPSSGVSSMRTCTLGGSFEAFDEAAYAVLHTVGPPLETLDDHWERAVTGEEVARVELLVNARIASRKPIAYSDPRGLAWPTGFTWTNAYSCRARSLQSCCTRNCPPGCRTRRKCRVFSTCVAGSGCLAILAALAFPDKGRCGETFRATRSMWQSGTWRNTALRIACG